MVVFRNPRHSGWREGHWTRLRMEEPFLCLPLFPAPRLWRVYFQVGFHFHLQVSDKSRQAPALSHSARGGRERGGTRAPTGVGSRTALWSGFLAFRPSCLKGLCIYFLKKLQSPQHSWTLASQSFILLFIHTLIFWPDACLFKSEFGRWEEGQELAASPPLWL